MTDSVIKHIIEKNGGNFKPEEFLNGRENLDRSIIEEIVRWRNWHNFMFEITSANRESGSHYTGKCIDGLVWSKWRNKQPSPQHIWMLATTWNFRGVGIYFDWRDGIGLHLDTIVNERQRPLRWLRTKGEYYYQSTKDGLFYTKDGRVKSIVQFF